MEPLYVKLRYHNVPELFWVKVRREGERFIGTVDNHLNPAHPLKYGDEIDMEADGMDFLQVIKESEFEAWEKLKERQGL